MAFTSSSSIEPSAPALQRVVDPFAPLPSDAGDASPGREAFRTMADSVEVVVDALAAPPARARSSSSPSAAELVRRAAELGPARMAWESSPGLSDPILDEKRQPRVAERRARLTRIVKIALGSCAGLCVLALGVSAFSGSPTATSGSTSVAKVAAVRAIVPVEALAGPKHTKAVRRGAPTVTTAAIMRRKSR